MPIRRGDRGFQVFQQQADAVLDQVAPVQNTYYTILDTTKNVKIDSVWIEIEDTNETLQVKITIDGEIWTSSGLAATHSTSYYVYKDQATATLQIDSNRRAFMYEHEGEARSIKVEVRKTTAAGTGNLEGRVVHGKIP